MPTAPGHLICNMRSRHDDLNPNAHRLGRSKAELASVRYNWNRLAKVDPLWAVLTRSDKQGGRWQIEEFLATGVHLVAEIRRRFEALGVRFGGERALDFGCGVGRVTRPLKQSFRVVVGVDIAEEMIRVAQRISSDPGVRYLHSPSGDLKPVDGEVFDLVMSYITLQHVPPQSARRLIGKLSAAVAPHGLLFLQIPTESVSDPELLYGQSSLKGALRSLLPAQLLERYRELRTGAPRMDMFGLARSEVVGLLERSGLHLLSADENDDTEGHVPGLRYYATR